MPDPLKPGPQQRHHDGQVDDDRQLTPSQGSAGRKT
jgi:hypothetical protein